MKLLTVFLFIHCFVFGQDLDSVTIEKGIDINYYKTSLIVSDLNSDLGLGNIEKSEFKIHIRYFLNDEVLLDIWKTDSVYKGNLYQFNYVINKSDHPVDIYNINSFQYKKWELPDSIVQNTCFDDLIIENPHWGSTYCGHRPQLLKRSLNVKYDSIILSHFHLAKELSYFVHSFEYNAEWKSSYIKDYYKDYYFKILMDDNSSVSPKYTSREEEEYYETYQDNIGYLNGFDRDKRMNNTNRIVDLRRTKIY